MAAIIDRTMGVVRRDKGTGEQPRWIASQSRWRARYVDANGKRRSVYSSTPGRAGAREAAAKRDDAVRRASLGIVDDPRLTVADFLERWLTDVAAAKLRPSSLERYRGIVRGQLVPGLGSVPLPSLTPQHIARAYAELAAPREITTSHARTRRTVLRARSAASLRYAHAVLHSALDQAVAWRLIERNPATGAALPRRSRPEMRPLSPDEARRFLAEARRPSARGPLHPGGHDRACARASCSGCAGATSTGRPAGSSSATPSSGSTAAGGWASPRPPRASARSS